jgi:hypothetical protein
MSAKINDIELAIKTMKIIRSAKTHEQYKSALRFEELAERRVISDDPKFTRKIQIGLFVALILGCFAWIIAAMVAVAIYYSVFI